MTTPEETFMARVNRLATRHNLAPPPAKRKSAIQRAAERLAAEDGPWEESCPEYNDGDDTCIVMLDGVELIKITAGTLAKRKSLARRIAKLLNEAEARMM